MIVKYKSQNNTFYAVFINPVMIYSESVNKLTIKQGDQLVYVPIDNNFSIEIIDNNKMIKSKEYHFPRSSEGVINMLEEIG